jgi:hypothetical protein
LEDRGRFLSAVFAAPFDDALRLVWADEHLDVDPRAEAISLESATHHAAARTRLSALVALHGETWAGALAPFLDLPRCTFRLGFLDTAVVSGRASPLELRKHVTADEWRTVRRVFFNGTAAATDVAKRRTPEAVTQLELLRRMPWLEGIGGVLTNVFDALDELDSLSALHLKLEHPPTAPLLARLAKLPKLTRLGLQENRWAPPQQMAPMWKPLTPPGLELLSLECAGRAPGWARLAKGLPTPRFAVQTMELGQAWFITRQTRAGLQLEYWFPDASYLIERCIAVLEDLPTADLASLLVWTPGALLAEHEARLQQAIRRFAKAETAVLTGRLRVHPVFDL